MEKDPRDVSLHVPMQRRTLLRAACCAVAPAPGDELSLGRCVPAAAPAGDGLSRGRDQQPLPTSVPPLPRAERRLPFQPFISLLCRLRCSLPADPKQLQRFLYYSFFNLNYKWISQIGEFCISHLENTSDKTAVKGRAAQS